MALQKLDDGQECPPTDYSLRRDLEPGGRGPQHPARDLELGGRQGDGVGVVRAPWGGNDRQLFAVVGMERVVDDDGLRTGLGILVGSSSSAVPCRRFRRICG